MAQITYCPECKDRIEYTYPKPNFCPHCAYQFNNSIATAAKKDTAPAVKIKPKLEAEVINMNQPRNSSQSNGFGFEIETFQQSKGISMEELVKNPRKNTYVRTTPSKKVNIKKALEIFREEAGAGGLKRIEIADNSPE
jgi:hypothetical protein